MIQTLVSKTFWLAIIKIAKAMITKKVEPGCVCRLACGGHHVHKNPTKPTITQSTPDIAISHKSDSKPLEDVDDNEVYLGI